MVEKGRGNVITETLRTAWKKQYEKYKDKMQEEVLLTFRDEVKNENK